MNRVKNISIILILLLVTTGLKAQELRFKNDSLSIQPKPISPDSTTTRPVGTDTLKVKANGIETTILYYAEDSIITKTLTNVTYLYGNAYIQYGDIKLDAAEIIIDRNSHELIANGVQDSTGSWVGLPIFKDGDGVYETRGIRYNFATNRAKITGVVTSQDEGYLSGEQIKKNPDGSAYIKNGKFIPCDDLLATTYIKAKKIKVIPGDKVITGPFQLYIGDIPTIFALPFGFFPDTNDNSQSGILFPTYGDERVRGIFLRGGGYFFGNNDYIRTAVTGDIYSKGSWGLNLRSSYKKRYSYSGSFDIRYNRNITPEIDEVPLDSKDFWVSWSHRPESRGNSRFSASVNAGTSTFNTNAAATQNFQNNVRSEFRSSVSLSGSLPGTPFSYALSARHNQNVQTGILDVSLPEFSFNMNRLTPFSGSRTEIIKRINFAWNFNTTNRITNLIRPNSTSFDIANSATEADTLAVTFATLPQLLKQAQNGAKHTVPISTSFPLLTNLQLSPSINFQELWYLQELDYTYIEDQNAVRIDTIDGFSRANTYSFNVGVATQLYGIWTNPRKTGKVEAIRHIMSPNLGFGYRPNFGQDKYGYYKEVQVDTTSTGEPVYRQLSIYNGFAYGSPSLGESASVTFGLSNKIEMKVRSDTAKSEKVAIIENLSVGSSYNFLADSFNLSDFNISARTSLFNHKLSVNAALVLDPYAYLNTSDGEQTTIRRVNTLAVKNGQGLGKIRSGRFSLSTNLNSKSTNNSANNPNPAGITDPYQDPYMNDGFDNDPTNTYGSINDGSSQQRRFVPDYFDDPNAYVDISVPWSVRLSYDFSFTKRLSNNEFNTTTRQAVKMNGNFELTPKWRFTFNTGFDLEMGEATQTSLGVYRDLGCWELNANWIPFGRYTSYSIDIQIKASALRDLKLSRRRSYFDN